MKKNHITIAACVIGIGSLIMIIVHAFKREYHLTIPYAFVAYSMTHIVFYKKKVGEMTFEELEERRWNWAKKIFPEATAESSLIKAEEEIEEIRFSLIDKQFSSTYSEDILIEEYTDALMCIFDSARRAGITPQKLKLGYHKKIEKNIARTWRKNPDNTYSHVKKALLIAVALFFGACSNSNNTYNAQYKKVTVLNSEVLTMYQPRGLSYDYRQITVTDNKNIYFLDFDINDSLPFKKRDTLTVLIIK